MDFLKEINKNNDDDEALGARFSCQPDLESRAHTELMKAITEVLTGKKKLTLKPHRSNWTLEYGFTVEITDG